MSAKLATVFDVQRFSLHDGPGIRTVVFFKGCSLRCRWCQNPESLRLAPEMAVYAERCIGSDSCAAACPQEALLGGAGTRAIDWSRCTHCGRCAENCPTEALRLVGVRRTLSDLLADCLEDREFYDSSGGGITLSGGEPVLQSDFLCDFLPHLHHESIHVLLETAGHYAWGLLEALLPHLDLVYFDWKLPSEWEYASHTRGSAERIARNLASLVERRFPLRVRMPLVPGLNTGAKAAARTARTLRELGVEELYLLHYNDLWEAKLARLDTAQRPLHAQGRAELGEMLEAFAAHGLRAVPPDGGAVRRAS